MASNYMTVVRVSDSVFAVQPSPSILADFVKIERRCIVNIVVLLYHARFWVKPSSSNSRGVSV